MTKDEERATIKIIQNYYKINRMIEHRRLEIITPFIDEVDENVGGGKMQNVNGEGVANKAIRIATDEQIELLKAQKSAIDTALELSDKTTHQVFDRWLSRRYHLPVSEIAESLKIGRATVYRKRDRFIKLVHEVMEKNNETLLIHN